MLAGALVVLGQGGAYAATGSQVLADGGLAIDLAGPVGVGAVTIGVVGLLFSLVRQQRRRAPGASGQAAQPEANMPSMTAETTRIQPIDAPLVATAGEQAAQRQAVPQARTGRIQPVTMAPGRQVAVHPEKSQQVTGQPAAQRPMRPSQRQARVRAR
jgi:hypothetical protein